MYNKYLTSIDQMHIVKAKNWIKRRSLIRKGIKTKRQRIGSQRNSLVPPDRSNFALFWLAVDVSSVMSRLNEARVPDGKRTGAVEE